MTACPVCGQTSLYHALLESVFSCLCSLILQTTASERAVGDDRAVLVDPDMPATYTSFRKRDKMDRWTKKGLCVCVCVIVT